MVATRSRVSVYAAPVIWAIVLVVVAVQMWWAMFGLRLLHVWTFLKFTVVLSQTVLLYMLAALVLPDFIVETPVDLRPHYYRHRRAFFGILIALMVVSLVKDVIIAGHLPNGVNLAFHGVIIATAVGAILTEREWYHQALAPAVLGIFCVYVALLFARLPG